MTTKTKSRSEKIKWLRKCGWTQKKLYAYLNHAQKLGVCHWSRRYENIAIWVRGDHGNDPKQWHNAHELQKIFARFVRQDIIPDPQSGCLLIHLVDPFWKDLKGK